MSFHILGVGITHVNVCFGWFIWVCGGYRDGALLV